MTVVLLAVFSVQISSAVAAAAALLPRVSIDLSCFPSDSDRLGIIYDAVTMFVPPSPFYCSRAHGSARGSLPPLVLEIAMFVLTVCKAQTTAKTLGWTSQIPLLRLIIRDGSWACLLVFGEFPAPPCAVSVRADSADRDGNCECRSPDYARRRTSVGRRRVRDWFSYAKLKCSD